MNQHVRSPAVGPRSLDQTPQKQYGAIPYRFTPDGDLQVLLITSRDTGRWVIPKGWPMQWFSPAEAAAQEAFEEAGVEGDIEPKAIGSFEYLKRLKCGRCVVCQVTVYPLHVRDELADWPERQQRLRSWVAPQVAADCVEEVGLAALIRAMGEWLAGADNDETLLRPLWLSS
ncbi:NUDIX hydrolase [Aurantimonas sp. C2-6-R+9]|uniref:NUDIX hydrolase n=1 Tax=unclassified Aurantimonas TaxID=2638230 RepID=UPI002E197946|nr:MULTISPECIES: NUDIX hydrolase [unclassified Aurantimonas]MEC5293208.1 NUDIX hydrolase [Aurantimonas sp. C2-3-R2]MEC5383369.1 NUDIX hydrolase [Aurantimonas sp. C2-6-R+9]MEC5414302.1 NUDIX hydrolase [Aurantimonas sp. C2-4-R8]